MDSTVPRSSLVEREGDSGAGPKTFLSSGEKSSDWLVEEGASPF